jgi:hypothetical protein
MLMLARILGNIIQINYTFQVRRERIAFTLLYEHEKLKTTVNEELALLFSCRFLLFFVSCTSLASYT